jgi:uncharacterized protein (DUF779 family)
MGSELCQGRCEFLLATFVNKTDEKFRPVQAVPRGITEGQFEAWAHKSQAVAKVQPEVDVR